MLAETAMLVGRHEEAAALLADLAAEATTDQQRVDVADSRTITLGVYLGREDEAMAVVSETLAAVHDQDLVDPLRASLAMVLVQASSLRRPSMRSAPARQARQTELLSRCLRRLDGAGDLRFAGGGDRGRTAWIRGARGHRLDDPLPARGPVHRPRVCAGWGRAAVAADELVSRGDEAVERADRGDALRRVPGCERACGPPLRKLRRKVKPLKLNGIPILAHPIST